MQGFHEARESFGKVQKYNGMLDCFRVILREEGSTGFFKGLAPSTIKVKKITSNGFVGFFIFSHNSCYCLSEKVLRLSGTTRGGKQ